MTFFAIRGSRQLTSEEFLAHLALAIRLENVGVLLGAGASKGVGGMVMTDVWALLENEYPDQVQFLRDSKFLADGEQGNVELLLDKLEIACLDGERVGVDLTGLKAARHALRKAVLRAAILDEKLWSEPDQAILHPKLSSHIRLVSRLAGNRQPGQAAPWAFTTNYDLALEWSAEALGLHCVNGFSGTHDRTFRPSSFDLGLRNVQARGEARFESDDWPGFMIFPGASKFVQTTAFVYGEVIRRFTEFLSRPNACLIVNGYGFTDDHINRLLVSALQNPTLQLIIYLPEIDRLGVYDSLAATGDAIKPNEQLKRLLLAQLPQVTVRGFGPGGFFDALANDLPEPAMLDEVSERARQLEALLKQATNIQVTKKPAAAVEEEAVAAAPETAPAPGDDLEDLL